MKIIAKNKKAFHDYEFHDEITCGIILFGHEVKSVRLSHISLKGSFAHIKGGELFITGLNISAYKFGNLDNDYNPTRIRRLLANKKEIVKLESKIKEKGFTLIPTYVGMDRNKIKVKIALGKGRKKHEKREVLKRRDIEKELNRSRLKV